MADKVKYEDLFDADLVSKIQALEKVELEAWETHKKWTLEVSKSSVVTKDSSETLKKLEDALKRIEQLEDKSVRSKQKLVDAEKKLTVVYQMSVQEQQARLQNIKQEAQLETIAADSLRAKQIALDRLQKAYTLASAEVAKGMIPNIQKLDAEVKKLEADMGRHQRNVGNYKSGFNGLSMSFNQLTREAPAFANSINTGFMALSNNIPMFIDEINQVKIANKEMNAEGIKTPSVFKTMLGAILSWQTAISAGVTLLTVFGGSIIDFFSGADDATKKATESAKKYNDELNQLNTNISNAANKNKDFNISSFFDYKEEDYNKILKKIEEVKNAKGVLLGTKIYDEVAKKYVETGVDEVQAYISIVGTETEKTIADLDNVLLYYDAELDKIKKEFDKKRKEETKRKQKENNKINAENGLEYLNQQKEFALSEARLLGEHKNILFSIEKEWDLKILNYKRDNNLINETEYKTALNNRLSDINDYIKEVGKLEENLKQQGGLGEGTTTITNIPVGKKKEFKKEKIPTIFERLGFTSEQGDIIRTEYERTLSFIEEMMKKEEELAQKRADKAKDEVQNARDNLREQQSLQQQGYASNVANAEKQLELAKKNQKKVEEEQRKATLKLIGIQTLEQTSNLITGSAKIVGQFSTQPWIMAALLASMWGTFAASKIKAVKATKETYGTGGTDLVGGGSHASGNDTYFGTRNGKRMYAEQGERWGIFNKRATSYYGQLLPDLINSANKLSLHNILQTKGGVIVNFNTTRLENTMERVARNTEEKIYVQNGVTVIKRGSNTYRYE